MISTLTIRNINRLAFNNYNLIKYKHPLYLQKREASVSVSSVLQKVVAVKNSLVSVVSNLAFKGVKRKFN